MPTMTREAFVAGVELMKSGDQAERLRGIARKLRPHDARLADLHEAEAQVVEMMQRHCLEVYP